MLGRSVIAWSQHPVHGVGRVGPLGVRSASPRAGGLPARWAFLEDYEQRWHKKALGWVVRASAELEVTYKWCRLTGSGVGSPGALDLSPAAACSTCGTHLCLCWTGLAAYRHGHSRAVLQEGCLLPVLFNLSKKKRGSKYGGELEKDRYSLSDVWQFKRNFIYLMWKAERFGERFHFAERKFNLKREFWLNISNFNERQDFSVSPFMGQDSEMDHERSKQRR